MRQVCATLFMTVGVFTLVLMLGSLIKEALIMLLSQHANLVTVSEAIGLMMPFIWTFALPMGMLTATLLVFGRFSADQELTAARASGVSLLSLIAPILILSLLLCCLSAWMNMELAPRCLVAYHDLINTFKVDLANAALPEQRTIKDFDGYILYIEKNRKAHLEGVSVFMLKGRTNVTAFIQAATGTFQYSAVSNELDIQLFDTKGWTYESGGRKPFAQQEYDVPPIVMSTNSTKKLTIGSMTYSQLRDDLRDTEERLSLPVFTNGMTADDLRNLKKDFVKHKSDITLPIRVQMHEQVAFSFACFGFTLIGIPLGVRVHRRETNVGIFIALMLVAVYYAFIIVGQAFNSRPEMVPQLIIWLPNFIFQAAGAVLLWRANRGL